MNQLLPFPELMKLAEQAMPKAFSGYGAASQIGRLQSSQSPSSLKDYLVGFVPESEIWTLRYMSLLEFQQWLYAKVAEAQAPRRDSRTPRTPEEARQLSAARRMANGGVYRADSMSLEAARARSQHRRMSNYRGDSSIVNHDSPLPSGYTYTHLAEETARQCAAEANAFATQQQHRSDAFTREEARADAIARR